MEEIMVSIIIPVYNGEKYIEDIYDNFRDIQNISIEVLFVDDGSKDNSLNLCKRISEIDSRFKVFHKENSGIADTRNYGIKEAKGRYCYFFDQDDQAVNEGIEKMVQRLDNSASDICIANCGVIIDTKKEEKNIIKSPECITKTKINQLVAWLIGNGNIEYGNVPEIKTTVWNCLFRKQFLHTNGITYEKFIDFEDDWVFMIRCLLKAKQVDLDDTCVYYWRITSDSESHRHKYVENFYENRKKVKKFIDDSLNEIGIRRDSRKEFEIMFQRRTFLWHFFNECYSEEKCTIQLSKIRQMLKQELPTVQLDLISDKYSRKENIILKLLLARHYYIAYLLNKWIFHFYFH